MSNIRSSSNDPMLQHQQQQQQQPMGGLDSSISGRPLDLRNNNVHNPQLLHPPPNTTLSMSPYLGFGGGDHQMGGPGSGVDVPPSHPPPPPQCQIVNPFLGTQPLVPNIDRVQAQQATGGSGALGLNQPEAVFNQDMWHRGYPGVLNLPPPFQVHPNLQSQIQVFHQDMGPHGGHMAQPQPPGTFLQGFLPSEIGSTVPDPHNSSHLLQPHVRQRARRRSRASRNSSIQHVHEVPQALLGATVGGGGGGGAPIVGLGQSQDITPTTQITVDVGDNNNGATVEATAAMVAAVRATARLEDAKLKGLEENYSSIGENFECNICFQKANEAVVTCCGHLFCWPCLYRWLHIHSYHKECPVCKGAIAETTITPIYGRECNALLLSRGLAGGSATERIPPRPPARRVESARQMRDREDRGREREQRERAVERDRERERELQQSGSRGPEEVLVEQAPGVGTTSSTATLIEEGEVMRDSSSSANQTMQDQIGGGGIAINNTTGRQQQQQQQHEIVSRTFVGHEDTTSSRGESISLPVRPPGVNATIATSFQDHSGGIHPPGVTPHGGGGGSNTLSTTSSMAPTFLQRRVSDRREQLRAALAASARSSNNVNSTSSALGERLDERRQMIAAATLLSQEWEDIVNISRMVGPVNPVQAAAWMAAVQGRLGSSTEGTSLEGLSGGDFHNYPHLQQPQQHDGGGGGVMLSGQPVHRLNANSRHMMGPLPATMISQDEGPRGDDLSLSNLVTINPLQAGDWLAAMRSRLTSMEKIVETLDSPLQVLQQQSTSIRVPSAQSSISQGGQLPQTSSSTIAATGLEELSLLDGVNPSSLSSSSTTSMEGPSSRAMEECAATSSEAISTTQPTINSGTISMSSTPVQSNSRANSESMLQYQEAPIPKPPISSRRRSRRIGEEGTTSMNNSNSHTQGHDVAQAGGQASDLGMREGSGCTRLPTESISSSRSKRRRLD